MASVFDCFNIISKVDVNGSYFRLLGLRFLPPRLGLLSPFLPTRGVLPHDPFFAVILFSLFRVRLVYQMYHKVLYVGYHLHRLRRELHQIVPEQE